MGHRLGARSQIAYDTLHPDLQRIISWCLDYCAVDFSLTEGHRLVSKQFEYYQKGRTKGNDGKWTITDKKKVITYLDGINKKGKHNYKPSLAFDFCAYVPDKPQLAWDITHLTYIAATFIAVGEFMYKEGMIKHKLRWGGNWDKDGDLDDSRFCDRPHLELYEP